MRTAGWWERNRLVIILGAEIIIGMGSWGVHGSVFRRMVGRLLSSCMLGRVLGRLLALTTLHLGLLQQSSLLGQSSAFLAILDLVLSDKRLGRVAEDGLVLAKLADLNVFRVWWMMQVSILLLDFPLASCQSVDAGCRSSGLLGRCVVGLSPCRGRLRSRLCRLAVS